MAAAKWIVSKEAIETSLSLVENVPTRNGIQSSEYIKLTKSNKLGGMLSLTSDLGAKAAVVAGDAFPLDTPVYLDRRLFSPFVMAGKESKIADYQFLFAEDKILVRHGSRRATYAYNKEVVGYEDPGKLENAMSTLITKKWTAMVDCASNCATADPITPSLNCVYIMQKGKFIETMSSNQRIVFYGRVESDRKPIEGAIAFPLLLVKVLRQEGALKVLWNDKLAIVDFPKGRVWQAVKTQARKDFPVADIRQMIKDALAQPIVLGVSSEAFVIAADRIAKYVAPLAADELALEVHMTKGSNKIQLVAGPKESQFSETLTALTSAKEDLVLEWPLAQVMPVILFSKDEGSLSVHLHKSGASCIASKNITLAIAGRSK